MRHDGLCGFARVVWGSNPLISFDGPILLRSVSADGTPNAQVEREYGRTDPQSYGDYTDPTVACHCTRGPPHGRRRCLAAVRERGGPPVDSERPRAASRDGPDVSTAVSGNNPLHWHSSGTLLVVDDDAGVRELMSSLLQRCGFTVLTASDGQAALETFRQLADQIRMVILDFGLPDTDGEALLHSMRRVRAGLRAILCSGRLTDGDLGEGYTGDWSAIIVKPFGLVPFLQTVRKVLDG